MSYSEAAYFDGNHCAHVAAFVDHRYSAYRSRKARETLYRLGVL